MVRLSDPPAIIEFGHFSILPHRRQLLAEGRPIRLGGRAFDLLLALIETPGAVIGKDELVSRIWPGRIVEENRLQNEIWALRKAFGADRELIRTVSGRGYQFAGEIREVGVGVGARQVLASLAVPAPPRPMTNVSESISELIGRETALSEVTDLVTTHRLVTLTGEGGIGKTRLGLQVARQLLPEFADGVWVTELAPLADPALVPVAVATALGLELTGGAISPERVANMLGAKRLLLVLDNCEHLVAAATEIAETLLRCNSTMRVLATSREPLRAEGEYLYRVPPLAVPAQGIDDVEEVLRHSSVRLFVARTCATDPHFRADGPNAAAAAVICRRLDGIPLAIELAAARGAAFGIAEIAARLDDRFHLLTSGHRRALPRHQTLRATFDWSYELLPEPERFALRRLAIFAGGFNLAAASAVVADTDTAASDVVHHLANLVLKSLVVADIGGGSTRYRLLETTRAYALEKLAQNGELDAVARRHAEFYRELFERAETEWETRPTAEWLADYGWRLDNLRAALDWAFSPGGDLSVGVALTAAAVPLWMHLSLMEECSGRVERALAAMEAGTSPDARREMKLHAAFAGSLIYIKAEAAEIAAAWTKALELAESLDDADYQLRALRGLQFFHVASNRYRVALEVAEKFHSLAAKRSDPNDRLIGERMIAVSQHYFGDQRSARRHIERALADGLAPDRRSHIIRFQVDQRISARVFLARILWLQGFPEQAMRTAESSAEEARAANHAISLCYALAYAACPIAFWIGDLAAAEHYAGMLLDHSTRHGLVLWHALGRSHRGVLVIKRGDAIAGLGLLRAGGDQFGKERFAERSLIFLTETAEALGRAGDIADGLAVVEEAIAACEQTEGRFVFAELLRVKGELFLLQGARGAAAAAEDHFRQALDWAHRQGALSWKLRAAMSLARLLRDQGRPADALALLQPVYDRFTEGFDTVDLKAAKDLLGALQ
jgi:predicted ATPase/DNA-binding winged helix-turn-helix (wHTH) protein